MVCYHSSIASCKSLEQRPAAATTTMSNSIGLNDPYTKPRHTNQLQKNRRLPSSINQPSCDRSQFAALIDVVILIAVVGAFGFLLYPYVKFAYVKITEIGSPVMCLMKEEVYSNPVIYGSLSFSMLCALAAAWATVMYWDRKCGNPYCKGLSKAAEFDIQLETEDCVKNSDQVDKNGVKKGLFELPRDHHRELEAELQKIAPVNGRAVLLFRARCGCSVGRLEVPGPRRTKKTKK